MRYHVMSTFLNRQKNVDYAVHTIHVPDELTTVRLTWQDAWEGVDVAR
jgi:hypothetical protein